MSTTHVGTVDAFDYVVVGAGASGAALAAKLTEDGTRTVLLLEAGLVDKKTEVHIPAAFSALFRSELDWNYDTTPQPELGGRTVYWPRGKMLGGSSSINAMMWVRGFAADYDHWAETAGSTWSYAALLPYFRSVERVEGNTDPDQGSGGAISIEHQRSPRSHTATFLKAVTQAGFAVVAPNTALPDGFSQTMVSQKRGKRFSSADGYLTPAKGRNNLTVRTSAQATRIVFEGTRAVGVEYLLDGVKKQVTAHNEVVLCGGAVNTPQLLMLSGIGSAAELTAHGIPVLVDSPEVGKNLRDHLLSGLIIETAGDTLYTAKKIPDIEIIFAPVAFIGEGLIPAPAHALTVGAILLKPESTGTITLASADPLEKAIIDPRYLTDAGGTDRARLIAGLGICEDILQAPALQSTTGPRFVAPEGGETMSRLERDGTALETAAHTLYHPVGTARMGTDAASVVDEELRVRGVQGLRVADASVMPDIIRGHTQAVSMVIGEKAADLLMAAAKTESLTAGARR